MEVLHARCSGLDVHKKTVTACVVTPESKEIKTFGTMTDDLLLMSDWLIECGVTHVAIESTGVYWKPIYNLLEGLEIELVVVNARDIKQVPGRKTDVKDAEWIADLLRHGLVRGSFIPGRDQRELRELVRYRQSLIRERAREANRVQKVLEGANIKLSSVATNVLGASGKKMIEEIISGNEDTAALAQMARGKLRNKTAELEKSLKGLLGAHQRMILSTQMRHIEFLDKQIEELSEEIGGRMRPFDEAIERLDAIPGIGRKAAENILAEISIEMNRFPSAAHLASWAGICPGNNESAGKRKSGRITKGDVWLKTALVQAAQSAARTKNTYFSAQYKRVAARRGAKRAVVAVAHSILVIIYHMLKFGTPFTDLGSDYFDKRNQDAIVRRSIKRLEDLGYKVVVEAA